MKMLTKAIRRELILALKNATNHHELDLSSFLKLGVSEDQIRFIKHSMETLLEHPYLRFSDFEENHSKRYLNSTLGDFESFKTLVGIPHYSFRDWLKANELNEDDLVCLPYLVYQHFHSEIQEDYMNGYRLAANLAVQLGDKKARYLTFQCGLKTSIPVNVYEMMLMIVFSRFGTYVSAQLDQKSSVLELLYRNQTITVEVQLYASSFSQECDFSVCLIDDLSEMGAQFKSKNTLKLEDFALSHASNVNQKAWDIVIQNYLQ